MRGPTTILVLSLCPAALAAELQVPGDHPTIQAAIDAAEDGDQVLIGPGIWNERLNFTQKRITVLGKSGAAETIIDGSGPGRQPTASFKDCPSTEMKLVGLTFTNGKGRNMVPRGEVQGGGVLIEDSSPTFVNCIFRDNHAQFGSGGGGSILGGHPLFLQCRFINNVADHIGGGLLVKEGAPQLINCTFEDNKAATGGGLYLWRNTQPELQHCQIIENTATGHGGGLYAWHSTATLSHCTFKDNIAIKGSAIASLGTAPELTECILDPGESIEHFD